METNKLYVSNLPYTATEEEIRTMFGNVDKVKSLRMVTTKGGKFKGFCYVEYETEEAARRAVMELNDKDVGERKMQVAISNPPKASSKDSRIAFPEREDGTFKRKAKMNFMVPRAVSKPVAATKPGDAKSVDTKSVDAKSVDTKSVDSKSVDSSTPPEPTTKSDNIVPKSMLSNSEFSKLFNK